MNWGDQVTIFLIFIQIIICIAHFLTGNQAKAVYWFACALANVSMVKLK